MESTKVSPKKQQRRIIPIKTYIINLYFFEIKIVRFKWYENNRRDPPPKEIVL
jgi:hypothetical protein